MCSEAVVIVPSLSFRSWFCIGRAKHLSLMGGWVHALVPNTLFQFQTKSLTVKLTAR